MATSRLVATLLLVLLSQTIDSSSIVRVDSGVYERVTVKIDDSVPRQHCRRAIDNIQVGLREKKSDWNRPKNVDRREMGRTERNGEKILSKREHLFFFFEHLDGLDYTEIVSALPASIVFIRSRQID